MMHVVLVHYFDCSRQYWCIIQHSLVWFTPSLHLLSISLPLSFLPQLEFHSLLCIRYWQDDYFCWSQLRGIHDKEYSRVQLFADWCWASRDYWIKQGGGQSLLWAPCLCLCPWSPATSLYCLPWGWVAFTPGSNTHALLPSVQDLYQEGARSEQLAAGESPCAV